jgi:putative hydrolase of the HAD superfamily
MSKKGDQRIMVTRVNNEIKAIFFDFGGVLAEEGFREGLKEIGRKNGLDEDWFFEKAAEAVYSSGYVTGEATEEEYWKETRRMTGIQTPDEQMRTEIMERFVIRPFVMEVVRALKQTGKRLYILSDQTDWLDELDRKYDFFKEFDKVFNSYYLGKGKRDETLFSEILEMVGLEPGQALFIDDNPGNLERAEAQGWRTMLFISPEQLVRDLEKMGIAI